MVCYYDPRNGGMLYAVAMAVEIMRSDDSSNQVYTAQIVDSNTVNVECMRVQVH
ncbi:hypothetical protein DPMN_148134 [Dreissena polymorpha]|uniref:Uncharacterized protein n=1 Tax=Dreissena polymorpha TaxID=45954 RepID=A0A9D4FEZ3_DREPO|nr:hypothetical protein DPMN_148134 [Dreissena polymorpha]